MSTCRVLTWLLSWVILSTIAVDAQPAFQGRKPVLIQKKEIDREPVYEWKGGQKLTVEDVLLGRKTPHGKTQVLTGYNVTYRYTFDDGISYLKKEFERVVQAQGAGYTPSGYPSSNSNQKK